MSNAYTYDGQTAGMLTEKKVFISAIKKEYPSYNDDQLLQEAIRRAKLMGNTTKIYWDGTDIYFSGSVTHRLSSIGGIDFCGSTVYMPDYDEGIILDIVPISPSSLTVSYDKFSRSKTTEQALFNKVFVYNGIDNADMCLGTRMPPQDYNNQIMYIGHTVKTSQDGYFETGDLYRVPTQGTILCANIHDYPSHTFDIGNATIVTHPGINMSTFIRCTRSNTHIHNFVLKGRSNISSYHNGIIYCLNCFDIRVSQISGINPIQHALTSGYFLGLMSVTMAHVYDVHVGDSVSWGCIGGAQLYNSIFEGCYLNRWDSHYAQYGIHTIKDCVLNHIAFGGGGNGKIVIENCILKRSGATDVEFASISLRGDIAAVFEGDIVVKDTVFERGEQPANLYTCFDDSGYYARPENSVTTVSPNVRRELVRCKIPDGCLHIFKTGSTQTADNDMYKNVKYRIEDTELTCTGAVVDGASNTAKAKEVTLDGCGTTSSIYITDNLTDCNLNIHDSDMGENPIHIKSNSKIVRVTGSKFSKVVADQTSNALIMTGNLLSESQDLSNFSNYSLAGNCQTDPSNNADINGLYASA